MVKGISAVDAINGSTKTSGKNFFKKLKQGVQDNQDNIFAVTGMVTGFGLYGAVLNNYVKGDSVTFAADKAQELAGKQNFIQNFAQKLKEKFSIDLNNPPVGINTSEPYMMDKSGHYIMDEYGAIPNPWYNPEVLNTGISAVNSVQFDPVTMDSFLEHAAANGAEAIDGAAAAIDLSFAGTDIPEVDDNLLEIIAKGIKNIFEGISDLI